MMLDWQVQAGNRHQHRFSHQHVNNSACQCQHIHTDIAADRKWPGLATVKSGKKNQPAEFPHGIATSA
jgi:hypothetical protein